MIDLLLKAILISGFCVGLRIVSDKGMILYFLRYPFEFLLKYRDMVKESNSSNKGFHYLKSTILITLLKPVIGCITCMSGAWTLVIDSFFFGGVSKFSILTIFVVSFLNTVLFLGYKKLENE